MIKTNQSPTKNYRIKNSSSLILGVVLAFSITLLAIPAQDAEALNCFSTSHAKFLGTVNKTWSLPGNWFNSSLPAPGQSVCIGDPNTNVEAELDIDFTVDNIELQTSTGSTLTILQGSKLTITSNNAALSNRGVLTNNGELENLGNFNMVSNHMPILYNYGTFTNGGFMTNSPDGHIVNHGIIINGPPPIGFIQNLGLFTNYCQSSVSNPGTINNNIQTSVFIGTNVLTGNPVITDHPHPNIEGTAIGQCAGSQPFSSNGDGVYSFGPTMGVNPLTNEFVVKGGFGIDGKVVDVRNWYTPFGWSVTPGNHTFTLKILSDMGTEAVTGVQLFTAPIGSWDANNPIWKIKLDRKMGAPIWNVDVIDKENLIGDVTYTAVEIEEKYILVSITISDMQPSPVNFAIGVRMIDDIGGMNSNWFNDGIIVEDTYAYPKSGHNFEDRISTDKVCAQDGDPNNRNSCVFEQKKQFELTKAHDHFTKVTKNKLAGNYESIKENYDYSVLEFDNVKSQTDPILGAENDVYLNFKSIIS